MMMHARRHKNLKTGPWPECAATANRLNNIKVNPHEEIAHTRISTGNSRPRKILKDFWRNGNCTQN